MPLHRRSDLDDLYAPIFSRLAREVPKYTFPKHETDRRVAFELVESELSLDGSASQNLATFCQTWESDEVRRLMDLSISKNLIDKDEYPQSAEIERRCVQMLADLWHAPDNHNPVGTSAIGSSEACMLAGMAMLRRWQARQKAAGKPTDSPNLVCGPVQVVWDKFCRYWDIEQREIPMTPGHLCMEPASMLEHVDENTIGVVPTLGVTYTGVYEPVADLALALDDLQSRTGLDVDLHIDAASGGFTAPFCAPDLPWDFRIPRVKSISASGHKFGLAPLGAGWVLWRDAAELPEELIFHVSYLGGDMPTFQLNFSRPAGQIVAQYYGFIRLGHAGYAGIHGAAYANGQYLADALVRMGRFEMVHNADPTTGIPAVTWKLPDGDDSKWSLLELADRLRTRGWQVPAYPLTGEMSHQLVQRALIRQEIDRDRIDVLIQDLQDAVDFLDRHPPSSIQTQEESGNFSH